MEEWVRKAAGAKHIEPVRASDVQSGVFCDVFSSPWYDDGVAFDWTALHQRLTRPSVTQEHFTKAVATLRSAGAKAVVDAATGTEEGKCYVTVVELKEPWALHPLSEQAQALSVFELPCVSASTLASASKSVYTAAGTAPAKAERRLYRFLRGPPGQQAVRDDMSKVMASAEAQLRGSGVSLVSFLSSFVIFETDFTELLHRTAAVFRALTDAGFTIDGNGSCLGPRLATPLRADGEDWWTTLPLQNLKTDEDVAAFLVAVFYQWLHDAYIWGCMAPLRLLPQETQLSPDNSSASTASRPIRLFETFVRGLVLPKACSIGLDAVRASLPEEGGSLMELAAVGLEKKGTPVGPQRWSVLELRLTLCQLGAYAQSPSEYLSRSWRDAERNAT